MLFYIVTQGEYSDTAIVALLSDRALAERLAEHLEEGAVIPIALDAPADRLRAGLLPYRIWVSRDGTVDFDGPYLPHAAYVAIGLDTENIVWAVSSEAALAQLRQSKEQ